MPVGQTGQVPLYLDHLFLSLRSALYTTINGSYAASSLAAVLGLHYIVQYTVVSTLSGGFYLLFKPLYPSAKRLHSTSRSLQSLRSLILFNKFYAGINAKFSVIIKLTPSFPLVLLINAMFLLFSIVYLHMYSNLF